VLFFGWQFVAERFIDWKNAVHNAKLQAETNLDRPNYKNNKMKRLILLQQGPMVAKEATLSTVPVPQSPLKQLS
jgi:hypothetical protein